MNLIIENSKSVKFYTSMLDVQKWLEINLTDFDWHISDIDGGWPGLNLTDPCWVTGVQLSEKLKEYDWQFVWSVFSAFPKAAKPQLSDIPYADGNQYFWHGSPQKQLKDSLFEIVCWDSSATLFIGLPSDLAENLIKNVKGIKDLDKFNQKNS